MLKIKQLSIIAITSLLVLSCGKSEKATTITGNIENNTADSIFLVNNDIRKAIGIKDGAFSDTLKLKAPAYFKFYAGNEFTWLYLTPGGDLSVKTDMNQFDNKLKFEGKLASENNFLAEKTLKEISMTDNPARFYGQDPESFKKSVDTFKDEQLMALDKSNASNSFKELEKKNIEYERLLMLSQYQNANSFYTQQRIEMPADFAKELSTLNLDDENSFVTIPSFKDLVLYEVSKRIDGVSPDKVEVTISGFKSQKIKDGIMSQLLMYTISSGGEDAERYYDIVQRYAQDENLKKRATAEFEQIKKLLPGQPSPEFKYPDINGNFVALPELKGKLVYIDVWATWCVPCLQEIPSLKKLEEEYHNKGINFVSISIDQKKDFEKWQKMVKEKELQGIQVFANNDWNSQFVREYNINGIPRFILLDKDGNIITADAPRPSDPNIRTLLDEKI